MGVEASVGFGYKGNVATAKNFWRGVHDRLELPMFGKGSTEGVLELFDRDFNHALHIVPTWSHHNNLYQ